MRWLKALLIAGLERLAGDTADRVGGGLGVLAWRLGIRRRVAADNLFRTLGLRGPARAAVLRRAYATMGANFLSVWTIGGRYGTQTGATLLNPRWTALVLRRHPSAVLLSGHLGTWEMGAHVLTRVAGEVLVYAKAQHDAEVDRRLNAARARGGVRVILVSPGDRTGAVQVIKALRRGAVLAMMADQRPSGGIAARFLGMPAWCHEGPAFFARKARVPLVPAIGLRRRAGEARIAIGRPLPPSDDPGELTQRLQDVVAAMIAAHPGQYFWHHRRFAGDPPALPPRDGEPWRQGLALVAGRGTVSASG